MQHVKAGDYMGDSAKRAVDTALRDAKQQRVGGTSHEAAPRPSAQPSPTPKADA